MRVWQFVVLTVGLAVIWLVYHVTTREVNVIDLVIGLLSGFILGSVVGWIATEYECLKEKGEHDEN